MTIKADGTSQAQNGSGRAWEPTAEQLLTIERLASRGVRKREIGWLIGKSKTTIESNTAAQDAYSAGHAKILSMLAETSFQLALGLDADGKQNIEKVDRRLLEYLSRTQLGWTETNRAEGGDDGERATVTLIVRGGLPD